MCKKSTRGVAILEFALISIVLVPLLLGATGIGLNMIRSLETIQLARDAGHMYARGADFSLPGNQTILATVGSGLGMTTSSTTSQALVIFSSVTYVDKALCAADGKVDVNGNPSGCTNYQKWVFTRRLYVGKTSLRNSNFGSPVTTGGTPVTMDSAGNISLDNQVTNPGDVATFTGINPYASVNGNVSGLPSGQKIYIAEAATTGISMPYAANNIMYSFNMF